MNSNPMKKQPTRKIRIRTVNPGEQAKGNGVLYYVTQESAAAIHLDNYALSPELRARVTLAKLPNGNLANSAGQEFEITRDSHATGTGPATGTGDTDLSWLPNGGAGIEARHLETSGAPVQEVIVAYHRLGKPAAWIASRLSHRYGDALERVVASYVALLEGAQELPGFPSMDRIEGAR